MSARRSRQREAEIAVVRPAQPRTTHQAVAGATERRLPGAMEVPIEQVVPDPGQPRRDWEYDDGAMRLEELAASVGEFGILQPLLVREEGTLPDGRQRYIIIAGERRHRAAERVGLQTVPVVVRGDEAARVRVLQLVENLQRQNLSPLDEARAFQELIDLEGLTPQALAVRLHLSGQHVRDRLRLLADQVLADAVERRQLSATAAREITKLPDEEVLTFRQRVLAGERLQTNDVVAVRARLEADGIVNPRRKVVRPARRPPVVAMDAAGPAPTPAPAVEQIASTAPTQDRPPHPPTVGDGDKTSFYPEPAPAPAAVIPAGFPAIPEPDLPAIVEAGLAPARSPLGSSAETREEQLTEDARAVAEMVAEVLTAGLWGERRDRVEGTLDALRDSPALATWWLLVHRLLREHWNLRP
jgi:ParB family transcriptional regulator, chromosome partitioning protein